MVTVSVYAQSNYPFNGLDMNMGNLSRLSDAKTRSISPENFTGEKGKGGMADPVKKKACIVEIQEYYAATVRYGRVRDGRVYMPPFDGILSQEAVWSIKTYLESRREQ